MISLIDPSSSIDSRNYLEDRPLSFFGVLKDDEVE